MLRVEIEEIWDSFPAWVKQVSVSDWMILKETVCCSGLKYFEGQELDCLGRLSPSEVKEVAMLRGEREVKSFCLHLRKEAME